MIPPFDDEGDLPAGVHRATWAEFRDRFCHFVRSDRRLRLCERIEQLVLAARRSGIVEQLIFSGSFVTAIPEPNDFDVMVIFHASVDVANLQPHQLDLVDGARARHCFQGDLFPVRSGTDRASKLLSFFQHTRLGKPVGVVEVLFDDQKQ